MSIEKNTSVSIIIPVYNTEKYLQKCVESVLCQSHREIEVLLVNDGSIDKSGDICDKYALIDRRVKSIHQENSGASMARNKGIDMAKGDYIMFVDSDDWIAPNMVEILLKAIITTGADMVISQVPGDPQLYDSDITISSNRALYHLLHDQAWWSPYGKMFYTKTFRTLRFPKATISEDYWLMSELLLHDMNIRFISSSFYYRTIRENSLSRDTLCERSFEEIDNVLAVWEKIKVYVPEYEQYAERNLAETLLKLKFKLWSYPNGSHKYHEQEQRIQSLIRSRYWDMVRNNNIPFKQKTLLTGCMSFYGSKIASWLYKKS